LPQHVLHLFDTIESRATSVAGFVSEGLAAGEQVLVYATGDHWKAVDERLSAAGGRLDRAIARDQLTVIDAHKALVSVMKRGLPDRALFSKYVAREIPGNVPGRTPGVRVYGELVDLLAEQGYYRAATALEHLWNELLASRRLSLMCGYSSVHFGNPLVRSALREICACHSRIVTDEDDPLGSFLIAASHHSGETALDPLIP
jgi:hypothetical protein